MLSILSHTMSIYSSLFEAKWEGVCVDRNIQGTPKDDPGHKKDAS